MLLMIAMTGLALADYPHTNRTAFMQSCIQSGGEQSHCSCTLERLEDTVSLERFIQADTLLKAGKPDPEFQRIMVDVTSKCVKNQTYSSDFITSCESSGSSKRHCECSLNHLIKTLGWDQLKYLSSESLLIGPSPAFMEAMVSSQVQCTLPEEHKAVFIGGCVSAGSTQTLCTCFHDYLADQMGLEKLIAEETRLGFGLPTTEFDRQMPKALEACGP